jgi:hypothetical protein
VSGGADRGGFCRGGESECFLEQFSGTQGNSTGTAVIGVSGGAGDVRQVAKEVRYSCNRSDSPHASSGAGESDVVCDGESESAQVEMTAWAADF